MCFGPRDFQNFNISLLAKTSWRLLQNPNGLLGRVLFGKYCPDTNFLLASSSSAMPHGWRSILLGRDLRLKNLGWIVGDGSSINIWNDPWLSLNVQMRPMGPSGEEHMLLTVADLLIPETREWDIQRINLILPDYKDLITNLKPSRTGAPDKLIWLGTKSGDYTTKSGANNSAGLGWVILFSSGNQSFKAKTRCVGSLLIAESLALREAIITCQNLQIKTVLFESDASQLVKSITDGHCPTELYGVVSDILFYASAFEFVNFSWIPRERNVIADRLAKDALL
uniref:RNase H type-1 domain-containing protein n=1 Tax=Brassica oleracea var. oleracea TaxID=109376 RepID=A0A0D3DZ98_BRAOL